MSVEMKEVWINDRWPLFLPAHRAARDSWPWWEAARLASMWHHLKPRGMTVKMLSLAVVDGYLMDEVGHDREVVYDIGAEEGDLPALWSSWGCDVVLFEPNDRVWPNIKAIWDANELRPPLATYSGFAAADLDVSKPGLHLADEVWPPSASGDVIGDHGFCNLSERPDIPRCTIDWIASIVSPPTAITIDSEGSELRVLRGAEGVLREHRPKVWVSVHREFMAEMYGDTPEQLQAYMEGLGYDRTFLAFDHESHELYLPL